MPDAHRPLRQFVDVARTFSDSERAYVYDFARYLWLTHHKAEHFECCGEGAMPNLPFEKLSDNMRNVWLTVAGNAYAVQRDAVKRIVNDYLTDILTSSMRSN